MSEKLHIAQNLEDALLFRKENDCIVMAGSSDLMVSAYQGYGALPKFDKPVLLIRNLEELIGVRRNSDGTVEIGACTTSRQIVESPDTPWVLKQAAGRMGAVALRNSATIGGNIANASPKGDTPGPLYLLDAVVNVMSLDGGRRSIPIRDFIIKFRTIDLKNDEIITSVTIPVSDKDMTYWFYHKIGTRAANAISKLTLCACAKVSWGEVKDFRVAATASGPVTNRSRDVENIAIGLKLDELAAKASEISGAFDKVISPRAMPEFRREATRRMIEFFIDKVSKNSYKKFYN